jgi:hypothetical protein
VSVVVVGEPVGPTGDGQVVLGTHVERDHRIPPIALT